MINLKPTKTKQQRKNNVSTTTLTSGLGAKSLFFLGGSFSRSFGLILMNSGLLIPATSHRVELGAAIFGASDLQRQRHRPCSQHVHLFIYFCLVHASLEFKIGNEWKFIPGRCFIHESKLYSVIHFHLCSQDIYWCGFMFCNLYKYICYICYI